MTDVTRLLENPVQAMDIVKKFVLLLVKHVLWIKNYFLFIKKNEKKWKKWKKWKMKENKKKKMYGEKIFIKILS
jgi:hypothetical protein